MKWLLALVLLLAGCGYHIAGRADLVPKDVHTIAIQPFGNGTPRSNLARLVPTAIAREFDSRTRYRIVPEAAQADAVLSGAILRFDNNPTIADPKTGRATGAQIAVVLQITLTDRHTGKVIFNRNNYDFRQRYEIATDPQAYFDESGTAIERLSRDVARAIVSAVLENF
jgi:outer membrane lipopolysaccharide assembly protein LptE/RlpB